MVPAPAVHARHKRLAALALSCFAEKLSFGSFSLHREHSIASREREAAPSKSADLPVEQSRRIAQSRGEGGVTDRIWYLFLFDLISFACTLRVELPEGEDCVFRRPPVVIRMFSLSFVGVWWVHGAHHK